jgi:hypothetical protein
MTSTVDTPIVPLAEPCYYRSFAAYEIPFRPVEPVTFAETEQLRAFCLAYHGQAGRVVRFDKILLVWAEKEPRLLALPTHKEPGSAICFAVNPDPSGGEPKVGDEVEYVETEACDEFFAGEVLSLGMECKIRRFRREISFTEAYDYWPSGRLRSRVKCRAGEKPVAEYYDVNGNKLSEQVLNGIEANS